MEEEHKGFDVNSFIKDNPDSKKMTAEFPLAIPEGNPTPAKKTSSRKKKEPLEATPVINTTPENSMSYIQNNVPYDVAYKESQTQLNEAINQLNTIGMDTMLDLQAIRNNKAIKSKYNIMSDMTANLTAIIGTKLSAIKEKNSIINNIQNLELKRIKDLKIDQSTVDDNTRIAELYNAFIQTSIGTGVGTNLNNTLGPNQGGMVMPGPMNTLPRVGIVSNNYDETTSWQSSLSPAQNKMLLQAKGVLDIVVMYDPNSGGRRYAAIDKATGQEIPNVELPPESSVWELDLRLNSGAPFAKNTNLNITYPVIILNNNTNSDLLVNHSDMDDF